MANAYKRLGYGRFKMEDVMSNEQADQTGYGSKVVVNPETIVEDGFKYESSPETEWELPSETEWLEEDIVVPTPENKREELYRIQESKRAAKIQVDQKFVMFSWLAAVGIAFIASAIVSFNGITAVAGFVGLSASWMAGLFFFFIELMYLIFLVAYLILASRVDENGKPESTWGSLLGMVAFGGIAVAANAFHTLDYWNWDITNPQVWAGIILSIAAPIAIISASKLASRVVFARAINL